MKLFTSISILLILSTYSFAQDKYSNLESASLHVNFQPTQGEVVTQNLKLEDAIEFDAPGFIKAHEGKGQVRIFGRHKSSDDYKYFSFNSTDLEESGLCSDYCEQITSLERVPYFGLAATPMDDFSGVEITNIIEGSNAANSPLQIGDIIIAIESIEISNPCNLTMAVDEQEVDQWVEVSYIRDGKTKFATVLMGYRIRKNITWVRCCDLQPTEGDLAVTNTNSLDLAIFPNPTSGITQFEIGTTSISKTQIQLMNMNGQVLKESIAYPLGGFFQDYIDLSKYADGVYVLHITQDKATRSERIVLQKK